MTRRNTVLSHMKQVIKEEQLGEEYGKQRSVMDRLSLFIERHK